VQVRNAAAQILYSQTVSHRRQEEIFSISSVAPSTQSGGEVMLFSRHAAITTFSKQRTALQFRFLCVKSLESRLYTCTSIPCGNALLEEASLSWR